MARFETSCDYVLANEGGKLYSDAATGEYSKYGITLKLAVQVGACAAGDRAFIENLNVVSAMEFYRKYLWRYDSILDQAVADKFFDMVVNMGAPRATKLAQRACNALGATLTPDGIFGYQTLMAINARAAQQLVLELCAESVAFYKDLVEKDPAKYGRNWDGWKERGEKRPQ